MDEIRLIDANALKKAFDKWWGCEDIPSSVVEDLIDEAPTINPERPQGKWENICTLPVIRKCSLCGVEQCGEQTIYDNFCPNCGSDMRPKKKLQTPSCLTNPERQAELLERYKEE